MTPLEKELLDALYVAEDMLLSRVYEPFDPYTTNCMDQIRRVIEKAKAESQSTPLPAGDIDLNELERAFMRDKGLENFRPLYTNIIVAAARAYLKTAKAAPLPEAGAS